MLDTAVATATGSARHENVLLTLKNIFKNLTGLELAQIDTRATFVEMGADSLSLLRASQIIQEKLGVRVPFRQLIEEYSTIDALAAHIDQSAVPAAEVQPTEAKPSVELASAPPTEIAPATVSFGLSDGESIGADVLEKILAQQLKIMSQQLELLRHGHSMAETVTAPRPIAETLQAAKQSSNGKQIDPQEFIAYQPIKRGGLSDLNARQQEHLAALIERVTRRTSGSKNLTQTYRPHWADSRLSAGFRSLWKEMVYQIVVERAAGARIWDIDGNEYVDITMGFGTLLYGHSPSFVIEGVENQLKRGIQLGPQSKLAGEVAKLICELTGVERVAFCNSGTEAVMSALRLARAVTGRTRIALFTNSYHGTFDGILVRGEKAADGTLRAAPVAPGVSPRMVEDVLLLHYNDPSALDILRTHAHELAAVMIELPRSRRPDIQPSEFLGHVREITHASGTALIFDEVVTGFRIHPGGAQAVFGVRADIVTYGKSVAAGMPIGVIAGRSKYLDAIDGGYWSYGDDSYPRAETTLFAGTYFKHPLVMAAAWASLTHLKQSGPQLQEQLNARTEQMARTLNEYFEQLQLPIRMVNFASAFSFLFSRELQFKDLFFYHLLEKGVYVWEGRACYLSTAHTEDDIEHVIRAVKESVAEMQAGEFLPGTPHENHRPSPTAGNGHGKLPELREPIAAPSIQSVSCACDLSSWRADVETLPITEGQKVLWFLAQMGDDASAAYNGSVTLNMRGNLNVAVLRSALQTVVDRHHSLRTTFSSDGDHQHIVARRELNVPLIDFSESDSRDTEVQKCLADEAQKPFDLVNGPLFRAAILRLGEQQHVLVLNAHHIVVDGLSYGVLLRELRLLYAAICGAHSYRLPDPLSLSEYARRQAKQQRSPAMDLAESYWLGQFADAIPTLELPIDHSRPFVRTYNGAQQRMALSNDLLKQLTTLSAQCGCTLYMTLLAGVNVLLHRLSGQDDFVTGVIWAGQTLEDGAQVGYHTNLLPVRTAPAATMSFKEYLSSCKKVLLEAYEHPSYPFNLLVEKLNLPRDNSRTPLVTVAFNLDQAVSQTNFPGLEVEIDTNPNRFAHFEIYLNLIQVEAGLTVECTYNTDLYEAATIERWMGCLHTLLEAIAADAGRRLGELPLLTEDERKQLLVKWNPSPNTYPNDRCVHELFEAQVEKTPEKVAAVGGNVSLTYRELNEQANKLALLIKEMSR